MSGSEKKYEQIAEIIKNRIAAGSYSSGHLPGLRTLASELGVSYLTVRQGLHALCESDVLRVVGNRKFEIVPQAHSKKRRSIGMLMPIGSAENSFVKAIQSVASESDAVLNRYTFAHYDDQVIAQAIDNDSDLTFFFIDPQYLPPLLLRKIQQKHDRLVSLAFDYTAQGVTMLDEASPDKSAKLLIEHIAGLGHRRIDILAVTHDNDIFSRRLNCLHEHANRHGLEVTFHSSVVPEFSQEYELSANLTRKIYRPGSQPDAICTLSVPSAIGIQRGLKDIGITTGRDCTLVSFEDQTQARYSIPSITVAHTKDFVWATRELVRAHYSPGETLRSHYLADAVLFVGESSCQGTP